jgi:hypothetical protein
MSERGHGHGEGHGAPQGAPDRERAFGAGSGLVRSEEDRISTAKIVVVGVASLVIFFVASLATGMYLDARRTESGPPRVPPEIGSSKIGMVEQQIFERARRGERDRERREERLRSYGWVDRPAGVVHLPIERAMELVAGGVRPAPGGRAPPPPPGGQP